MNVILVLIDSLNRHYLEPYEPKSSVTPNFTRFAKKSVRFGNHFVGSLPCMPARRELFTGRKDFLWRPWGHVEPFDTLLPHVASENGYKTMLITDHYHYWEENANGYMESFQGLEMIRGHELDNWRIDPLDDSTTPPWVEAIERYRPGQGKKYYSNVRDFGSDEEYFSAKVFNRAAEWLDTNYKHQKFFLQVELFDVHEPFHVPEPFRSMWLEKDDPNYNCWPPYQDREQMAKYFKDIAPDDLEFVRAQYRGKVSMADKWFGRFLDKLDALGVWEDTMVIVTTDHGHDLGERQAFGKQYPHYDSHANIPLFIYHPNLNKDLCGSETRAITSTVDLNPTIIDAMGAHDYQAPHGRSFLRAVMGETTSHRDSVLYGMFGFGAAVTDGETVLIQGYDNRHPLNMYSTRIPRMSNPALRDAEYLSQIESGHFIPGVPLPQWKIPIVRNSHFTQAPSVLYRRDDLLFHERNLYESDLPLKQRMQDLMREVMAQEGAPPEQYVRLGLSN